VAIYFLVENVVVQKLRVALATDPKFILLDEPFAGVDPVAVEDIQRIVAQLKNKNIGILITDHNVQETLAITDKTYLMFEGGILKAGIPEELVEDEMVRRVYLGQNFELRRKKKLEILLILLTEKHISIYLECSCFLDLSFL
jgi:ABC-type multidrug transport system ATPase subunit